MLRTQRAGALRHAVAKTITLSSSAMVADNGKGSSITWGGRMTGSGEGGAGEGGAGCDEDEEDPFENNGGDGSSVNKYIGNQRKT